MTTMHRLIFLLPALCMLFATAGCASKTPAPGFSAEPGNTARIAATDGVELSVSVSDDFPFIREQSMPPESRPKNIKTDKALVYMKSENEVIVLLDVETGQDLYFQIRPKFPETGSGWIDGLEYDYYVTHQSCRLQYVMYYPVKQGEYLAVSYAETVPALPADSPECREWDLRAELSDTQQAHIRKFKQRAHNAVRVRQAR